MPLATIKFLPGVNQEITQAQGMAQVTSSNLIRWKMAGTEVLPEKLGGWELFYPLSIGSAIRDLHAWEGLNAHTFLGIGAEESLDVIRDGVLYDITPTTTDSSDSPAFTTTASSTTVQVDDPNVTASVYDSIFLKTQIAIGGIVLFGSYQITSVIDSDSYTIEAATPALSSVGPAGVTPEFSTTSGSAFVNVELENHGLSVGETFPVLVSTAVGGLTISGAYIVREVVDADNLTIGANMLATSNDTESENSGDFAITYYIVPSPAVPSTGYGDGGYGDGGYGGSGFTPSTGIPITATNWTLDNWGEVFLACPTDGPIYQWAEDTGLPIAQKIVAAPEINGGIFVAQPAQILVAWASSVNGVQDPLLINWSDAGNYNNWTVSSQTQAGGYRLPTGSKCVGGMAGPNFNIIWTDVEVWAMDYIQPPLIFGFNAIGQNCGLIGRHAFSAYNSVVYWMGYKQFYVLNGENVTILPCPVWDVVFQDLDTDNTDKIYCGVNSLFGEIWWFYPSSSGGTGEVDRYVKVTPSLGAWDFGILSRTAWIDQSPVGPPIGADANGFIFQHETSPDADGQPMDSWFESGFFQINDGQMLSFVDLIIPDFKYGTYAGTNGAILSISVSYTDYPGLATKTVGPYNVMSTTQWNNTRLRGRFMSVRIESADLGSFWRLGGIKVRSMADGTR